MVFSILPHEQALGARALLLPIPASDAQGQIPQNRSFDKPQELLKDSRLLCWTRAARDAHAPMCADDPDPGVPCNRARCFDRPKMDVNRDL